MTRLAKRLTNYVIHKGMVNEDDRNIYEYGFEITIEVGLFMFFCFFSALCLRMLLEGILFFIIFAPLRSYAGGLHLKKYYRCFALSCLTFLGVLLLVRYIQLPMEISFIALLILSMFVYLLYPVETINRKVDDEENRYFRRKLRCFLLVDIIIAVVFIILKYTSELFLITITFAVVVITMLIGKSRNNLSGYFNCKIKNSKENTKDKKTCIKC